MDPDPQQLLTVEQVASMLHLEPEGVRRLTRIGQAVNGRRVRLRSVRVGCRSLVKREWVSEFVDRIAQAGAGSPGPNDGNEAVSGSPRRPAVHEALSGEGIRA